MTIKGINPNTVSEEKAEPDAVDYPADTIIKPLDAERTTADDITDTGYIWDQTLPGETQPMPAPAAPLLSANRVTIVSDNVLFGSAEIGPNTLPFQLVPEHRDRLRVTIMAITATEEPPIYLGSGRNISPSVNGFQLISGVPIRLETRGGIYVMSGTGSETSRVQWAAELVTE